MCFNEFLAKLYRALTKNNGVIKYSPKGKDWGFLSGNMDTGIYLEDGNFKPYRPKGELQRRGDEEKMSCVSFSDMNVLESIINYLISLGDKANEEQKEIIKIFNYFGLIKDSEANFSDRYVAKMSNTSWRGNSFKQVADAIRKYGLVGEDMWPYVASWNEYYKTVDKEVIERGKKLLDFISFNYEFVYQPNFGEAGKRSPVQSQVYAWGVKQNDIYIRTSNGCNHAIDRDYEAKDKYHGIFDSYEPFDKKVAWDFNMDVGVIWSIRLKKPLNVFDEAEIKKLINRGLEFIQLSESHGEVYKLEDNSLVKKTVGEITNEGIRSLEKNGKLVGISNNDFKKLFI